MWFNHASGYFRLGGGFSDFLALISIATLIARMKGPEINFFSVILPTSAFRYCLSV